jgi:hypothetical protein
MSGMKYSISLRALDTSCVSKSRLMTKDNISPLELSGKHSAYAYIAGGGRVSHSTQLESKYFTTAKSTTTYTYRHVDFRSL